MKQKRVNPYDFLLPYQQKYCDDGSRFKAWCKSRQIGGSFTSAAEIVRDLQRDELNKIRGAGWLTMSAGERQALEWLRTAKNWFEAIKVSIADLVEERNGGSETLLRAASIVLPGGNRLDCIPANPDTARGYSRKVLLDEFARHENPDAIWAAVFPIVTSPFKGELKLRVVSTPNGINNRFHQIITANKQFSVHKTSIHDAVAQGYKANIAELREAFGDPDLWAQEYECEFLDSAAVLLPYDLIAKCESAEATTSVADDFWQVTQRRPLFLGIDFARKRDLSVAWTDELVGDVLQAREVLEMRGVSTPDQVEILRPRIKAAQRVALDYTGPGVGMGDLLVKEFGEWNPEKHLYGKIELCTFTNALKVELFSKLRMAFEGMKERIPVNRAIREDLHSMQRMTTANGTVTYRAPHTEDGHADRCTAKALARRAFSFGAATVAHYVVPEGRRAQSIASRKSREVFA